MPLGKFSINISQPIVLNRNYLHSVPGILKCAQSALGLISFLTFWLSCRGNYDPYVETYSGFVGGDLETFALLIYFTCFFISTFTIITFYLSITTSTFIPKTVYEFALNCISFLLVFIISLTLLITVSHRNSHLEGFPPEPGFGGKVTTSVFGLINSLVYGANIYFAYQSYINS